MSERRLRFGLCGTGDFGPYFAPYIAEVGEIVAICDPSTEARALFEKATGFRLPGFDSHEQMLAEVELDAVVLTSPNFTHKDATIAAAQAGKHVFCEKAMAVNVPDCWEMVRACEEASVRLMVGHKRRLRPPWARMIELRDQIGPVLAITACLYHDARPYNFPQWWRREALGGGLLDISGVHVIDWMRAMCGDVATVQAVAAPRIDTTYDFPDTLHVSLRFDSGAIATLSVSLTYPLLTFRESGGPLVICRQGGMRFVPHLDHIDLQWQRLDDPEPRHERFDDLGFDAAYRKELGDFVRWVKEGTEPCLTWIEGLRCVEVMEAAHRSARENGSVVTLPLYPELEPGICS